MVKQINTGLIDPSNPHPRGWDLVLNTEFEMLDHFISTRIL
jgi:hypothetical protein